MPNSAHNCLVKAFEPSSRAADLRGPNAAIPALASSSTRPATSGPSGPTTTRSMAASRQNATTAALSWTSSVTIWAISAMPGLPGAANNRVRRALLANANASACSRPPEPINNTFTCQPSHRRQPKEKGAAKDTPSQPKCALALFDHAFQSSPPGSPHINAGKQEQPHHVNKVPIPGGKLETEVLLGRKLASI